MKLLFVDYFSRVNICIVSDPVSRPIEGVSVYTAETMDEYIYILDTLTPKNPWFYIKITDELFDKIVAQRHKNNIYLSLD